MKVLFLLLLLYSKVYAASVQIGFGGVTPHFVSEKKNYCNQWNNTGIIVNRTNFVRVEGAKLGFTYMQGEDSICSPIEGIFLHYFFEKTQFWSLGMSIGGYSYIPQNWIDHKEKTPESIEAPQVVTTDLGNRKIVPVLALDFALYLIKGQTFSLKLNNQFTPIIFHHSLAFEIMF